MQGGHKKTAVPFFVVLREKGALTTRAAIYTCFVKAGHNLPCSNLSENLTIPTIVWKRKKFRLKMLVEGS